MRLTTHVHLFYRTYDKLPELHVSTSFTDCDTELTTEIHTRMQQKPFGEVLCTACMRVCVEQRLQVVCDVQCALTHTM